MDDKHKTKAQLLGELEELRRRVAQMDKAEESQPNHHPPFLAWAETAASTIFIFQDPAFRYTNPAMSQLTGYTQEELLATNIWSLIHPEFRELIRERVSAWQRGEPVPTRSEFKILPKSGETRWLNADSTFVEFDGSPAALTIAFDSTEHKLAEESLCESEERYRNIVETAQEGIWMVDEKATTTYVNHHLAEMFGYTRDAMLGRSVFDFVDDAARKETRSLLERGRQGIKWRHDFRFLRKDGSDLWTIVSTTPLFDGGGRFAGGLAMLVDVTERHWAEAALRESEERFRTLVNSMDDIVFTVDRERRYSGAFGRWLEMFGLEREAFVGRTASEILGAEAGRVHDEANERGLSGEQVVYEWSSANAQGTFYFQTCLSPIRDRSGEVTGLVGVGRDITERKRADKSIRFQANLLDEVEQAVVATDLDGNITYWNRFAEELYGWSAAEALGRYVVEVTPAQTTRGQASEIVRHLREGNRWSGEFLVQHKDHTPFTIMLTDWPLYDDKGTMVGIVGISSDITERKRAEDALRASEERYRDLVENARDIIYSYDLKGNYTSVNKVVEQITGYTREEALKLSLEQSVAPEYLETARQMIAAKLAGQKETVYDLEIIAKDGRRITVEINTRLVLQDGVPLGIQGIARDVTERKRAEEALRQSEERFRRYFELGLIGMAITSPARGFIEVNDKMCEILGYERAELLQLTWEELTHPDDLAADLANFERILAAESDGYSIDKRFIGKDGGVIPAAISVSCVRRADRSVDYFIALLEDVTERKRAEQALRESRAHLYAILDNCPAMIFEKDLDGHYLQVNQQFERTFNLPPEQVLCRTDDELFPPELAAAFRATDCAVLEAGRSLEFEEHAVYADGLHTYIVHKFPLQDTAGNVYAVGGISTDITARKRAEDDLRKQKEILQKIFDHIPVMVRFLDEDGRVKLVNREWERKLGWSLKEIEGRGLDIFAELYPDPEYRQYVLNFIAASTGEFAELKTTLRDGRVIDTTFANVRLEDGTNIGIGRDITERKRAADLLRRQAAQLAALHEITLEISAESDLSRILEVVTRRAAELLDASPCSTYIREREEAALTIVASLESKFVGLRLEEGEGLAGRALATGDAQAVDDYSVWQGRAAVFDAEGFGPAIAAPLKWQQTAIGAISLARKRGEEPFTGEDLRLLEQFAAEAAIAIHQATLFDEVQESQKRLQILSHRLIDAQEAERKRLSRELHDQIGQALTAVQISLQALQSSPGASGPDDRLSESLAIIDHALEQVHDLSLDLRPSMLDDLGLVAALRWYVKRVASRAGLIESFTVDVADPRLAPDVETACFRIAQEALTNVLRHAHAASICVGVKHSDGNLELLIRDDGVGFNVRDALRRTGPHASLGLQGMQERAAALGGIVDIKSKHGSGTDVRVSFPLTPVQSS
jgi:PAS domain S-box-containing protein